MTNETNNNNSDMLKNKIEELDLSYRKLKPQFDNLIGEDSQKYINAYTNMLILDNDTRSEFINSSASDVASFITKGKKIIEEYGINPEHQSLYQTLKESQTKLKQLEEANLSLKQSINNKTEPLPELKNSSPDSTIQKPNYCSIFNGR